VIALFVQDTVDFLALAGHAQTRDFLWNGRNGLGMGGMTDHGSGKLGGVQKKSRMIPIPIQIFSRGDQACNILVSRPRH
jgi:hypothetical protein